MERRGASQAFRVLKVVCFRELEEVLNQFFLSRSLDVFKSSYGLVLPTNVREKLYLRDSKKCNSVRFSE